MPYSVLGIEIKGAAGRSGAVYVMAEEAEMAAEAARELVPVAQSFLAGPISVCTTNTPPHSLATMPSVRISVRTSASVAI